MKESRLDSTELSECLSGEYMVLEPLTLEHVPALSLAVADGELWQLWYTSVPHPDEMAVEFRTHWHNQAS
ncbi:acetyltransferase, GNAT family protein [Shewanella benthica KT99]|uniref:Acetyltransferase, GNAT family protein n=1 Tax=Shewanella benthica KT99 TaxID=314608 RepID=A9DK33_9GAMM|nr:acetyltransferase, GNAT family protein [Shewanella benthica KT99]